MSSPPPLTGIRVLEFAGLAPGPFAGMLLADFGATVLRIDRASPGAHTSFPPPATEDQLVRRKSSIAVNIKRAAGVALIKALIPHVDVVIDPFRPGVLEKAGLGPENVLMKLNPRLVVGRMTGFRRDGKYSAMAGHDINYIAVSGVLSMLGRKGEKPYPPGNILGDFAGGGAMCFLGIVLALLGREMTGQGQVVEANMVDGSAYLATMPRFGTKGEIWRRPRGENMLDGGAPWYGTYKTKDGKYFAIGAIEPQFFAALMKGLNLPTPSESDRWNRANWPALTRQIEQAFKSKSRTEWEAVFDGTDACATPVLTQSELEEQGFDQRPVVTLKSTPSLAISKGDPDSREPSTGQGEGVEGDGWDAEGLRPGSGGEEVVERWVGWRRGRNYVINDGGLERTEGSKL